jgi:dynein heavy chain
MQLRCVAQVLDGPVDHVWVEALNPVLDDNRTLCLSSGETIPLREGVNLVMEVRQRTFCMPKGRHVRIGDANSDW